jgi:hypothetical protein
MKSISFRKLKRETPEDRLSPGESLTVRKHHGKVFELKRVDAPPRSRLAGLREAMQEVPNAGGKPTDVAAWC